VHTCGEAGRNADEADGTGEKQLHIGSIEVTQVIDATATIDPVVVWGSAAGAGGGTRGMAEADWARHPALLRDDGRLDMPVGSFLVRSSEQLLLIDLGYGPEPPAGLSGGFLLDNLAAHGIQPGDITDVVFSHLHPDHVGWASISGAATFPHATHHCHVEDWSHFVTGSAVAGVAALLSPLADRMEMWTGAHRAAPGVDLVAAPGHTPGNAYVILSSGTDRAFLLGDIVHCPVELVDDDWAGLGDVDPVLARTVRVRLARELEGTDVQVAGAHFPGMHFGRLLAGEGSRSWRWS
jgi:glyoxylase-like metal-dependent hydrolase (beta-lactamase superfamily II)